VQKFVPLAKPALRNGPPRSHSFKTSWRGPRSRAHTSVRKQTTHFTQSKSKLGSACHQSGTLGLKYGQAEAPSDEDLDRVKNLLLAQTTNGRGFRAPRFSVRIRRIWDSDQDHTSKNQEIGRPRPLNIATIKFAVGLECVRKYVNECSHFRPPALASAFTAIRTILPRTPAFV
jgi:hypothetical protein